MIKSQYNIASQIQICLEHQYLNVINQTCLECIDSLPHCYKCYNNTWCNQCNDGFCINSTNEYECNYNFDRIGYYLDDSNQCSKCQEAIPYCIYCRNSSQCDICQNKYYAVSNYCLACNSSISHCYNCSNDLICLNCYNGYFLINGSCQACDSSCFTCELEPTKCTSCDTGINYFNQILSNCNHECNIGYFTSFIYCLPCDSICQSCILRSNQCLRCNISGDYPYLNEYIDKCQSNCTDGYYLDEQKCKLCQKDCQTCNIYGCTSCNVNGFLPLYTQKISTCSKACVTGYYQKNYQCLPCDFNCLECQNISQNCTKCNITSDYPYYTDLLNQCSSFCENGYYLKQNDCLSCDISCLTCSGGSQICNSCNISSSLYPNYNPKLHTCTNLCQNGYYLNISLSQCLTCDINCSQCSQVSNNCTSCLDGYYLNTNQMICLKCDISCQTCSLSSIKCNSCNQSSLNNYLNQILNTCSGQCVDGFYINGSQCSPCNSMCLTCNISSFYCYSCNISSQFPYLNQVLQTCSLICIDGYYSHNNYCLACDVSCMTCSIVNINCTQCNGSSSYPYYNQDLHQCAPICVDGYYLVNSTCARCEYSCGTCNISDRTCTSCNLTSQNPYLNSILHTCTSQCEYGYYLNQNYCLTCNITCLTCSGGSQICNSCNISSSLYPNYNPKLHTCTNLCQIGYYLNISLSQCLTCDINCSQCSQVSNNCTSCLNGYYLNTSQMICLKCDISCQTCSLSSIKCNSCQQSSLNKYFNQILNTCSGQCVNGFYINGSLCSTCNSMCLTCNISSSNCYSCNMSSQFPYLNQILKTCSLICADGYYLHNNYCLACDIRCRTCSIDSKNCTNCNLSSSYPYYNQDLHQWDLTCSDGYYLFNNLCMKCESICGTCNISSQNCISCNLTSQNPYLNSVLYTCTSQCQQGYFLNENYCLSCDISCLTCILTSTNCISCNQSSLQFTYYNPLLNTCNLICQNGFYLNSNSSQCHICEITCLTCSQLSIICLSCNKSSQYMYFNEILKTCSAECVDGYYLNDSQCLQCDNMCLTCDISSINCLSCEQSSQYPYLNQILQTCSLICADGYYLRNNYCLACDISCMTCSIDSINCTNCNLSSSYPYYNQDLHQCDLTCSDGYYLFNDLCMKCESICGTCNLTNQNCTSCKLTSQNPYLIPALNKCTSQCFDGYYLNVNKCLLCDISCLTCQIQDIKCQTCNLTGSYPYYNSELNTCGSNCTNGFFQKDTQCLKCNISCMTCILNSENCLSCNQTSAQANFNYILNTCSNKCIDGYYINNYSCLQCHENCLTCNISSFNCLSCNGSSLQPYLNKLLKICTEYCADGYFLLNHNCSQCDETCRTCDLHIINCTSCNLTSIYPYINVELGTCTSQCIDGYYLDEIKCLPCSNNCFTCQIDKAKCTSCDLSSLLPYYNSELNMCSLSCSDGYFLKNRQCEPCDKSCLTCDLKNINCTSCEINSSHPYFNQILNQWSIECQEGFYLSMGDCIPCQYNCLKCNITNGQCISCNFTGQYPYFNQVIHNCSSFCSEGYYLNETQCLACNANCLSCYQTSTNCIKCNKTSKFKYLNEVFNLCTSICPDNQDEYQCRIEQIWNYDRKLYSTSQLNYTNGAHYNKYSKGFFVQDQQFEQCKNDIISNFNQSFKYTFDENQHQCISCERNNSDFTSWSKPRRHCAFFILQKLEKVLFLKRLNVQEEIINDYEIVEKIEDSDCLPNEVLEQFSLLLVNKLVEEYGEQQMNYVEQAVKLASQTTNDLSEYRKKAEYYLTQMLANKKQRERFRYELPLVLFNDCLYICLDEQQDRLSLDTQQNTFSKVIKIAEEIFKEVESADQEFQQQFIVTVKFMFLDEQKQLYVQKIIKMIVEGIYEVSLVNENENSMNLEQIFIDLDPWTTEILCNSELEIRCQVLQMFKNELIKQLDNELIIMKQKLDELNWMQILKKIRVIFNEILQCDDIKLIVGCIQKHSHQIESKSILNKFGQIFKNFKRYDLVQTVEIEVIQVFCQQLNPILEDLSFREVQDNINIQDLINVMVSSRSLAKILVELSIEQAEIIKNTEKLFEKQLIMDEAINLSNEFDVFMSKLNVFNQISPEIQTQDDFLQIVKRINAKQQLFILRLMVRGAEKPLFTYNQSLKELDIKGYNVFVSLLNCQLIKILKENSVQLIRITAKNTLYIDQTFQNYNLNSKNVVILANKIEIEKQCMIDVSGLDGNKQFINNKAYSATNQKPGNGSHGENGCPGNPGGNIYIEANTFNQLKNLSLKSNGGKGTYGQCGGDGIAKPPIQGQSGLEIMMAGTKYQLKHHSKKKKKTWETTEYSFNRINPHCSNLKDYAFTDYGYIFGFSWDYWFKSAKQGIHGESGIGGKAGKNGQSAKAGEIIIIQNVENVEKNVKHECQLVQSQDGQKLDINLSPINGKSQLGQNAEEKKDFLLFLNYNEGIERFRMKPYWDGDIKNTVMSGTRDHWPQEHCKTKHMRLYYNQGKFDTKDLTFSEQTKQNEQVLANEAQKINKMQEQNKFNQIQQNEGLQTQNNMNQLQKDMASKIDEKFNKIQRKSKQQVQTIATIPQKNEVKKYYGNFDSQKLSLSIFFLEQEIYLDESLLMLGDYTDLHILQQRDSKKDTQKMLSKLNEILLQILQNDQYAKEMFSDQKQIYVLKQIEQEKNQIQDSVDEDNMVENHSQSQINKLQKQKEQDWIIFNFRSLEKKTAEQLGLLAQLIIVPIFYEGNLDILSQNILDLLIKVYSINKNTPSQVAINLLAKNSIKAISIQKACQLINDFSLRKKYKKIILSEQSLNQDLNQNQPILYESFQIKAVQQDSSLYIKSKVGRNVYLNLDDNELSLTIFNLQYLNELQILQNTVSNYVSEMSWEKQKPFKFEIILLENKIQSQFNSLNEISNQDIKEYECLLKQLNKNTIDICKNYDTLNQIIELQRTQKSKYHILILSTFLQYRALNYLGQISEQVKVQIGIESEYLGYERINDFQLEFIENKINKAIKILDANNLHMVSEQYQQILDILPKQCNQIGFNEIIQWVYLKMNEDDLWQLDYEQFMQQINALDQKENITASQFNLIENIIKQLNSIAFSFDIHMDILIQKIPLQWITCLFQKLLLQGISIPQQQRKQLKEQFEQLSMNISDNQILISLYESLEEIFLETQQSIQEQWLQKILDTIQYICIISNQYDFNSRINIKQLMYLQDNTDMDLDEILCTNGSINFKDKLENILDHFPQQRIDIQNTIKCAFFFNELKNQPIDLWQERSLDLLIRMRLQKLLNSSNLTLKSVMRCQMVIQTFNYEEFDRLFMQLEQFDEIKMCDKNLEQIINLIIDLKLQEQLPLDLDKINSIEICGEYSFQIEFQDRLKRLMLNKADSEQIISKAINHGEVMKLVNPQLRQQNTTIKYDIAKLIKTCQAKYNELVRLSQVQFSQKFKEFLTQLRIFGCQDFNQYKIIDIIEKDENIFTDVLAFINSILWRQKKLILRDTQMCAILLFLNQYSKNNQQFYSGNLLQEIKTGEGKSLIVAVTALIYSLYNYQVDVVTSSSVLAIRDQEEIKIFFDSFNVSIGHCCHQDIDKRKSSYQNKVVYGDIGSFQRDFLETSFYNAGIRTNRPFSIIIIDEADSMLIDKGQQMLYLPHQLPELDKIENILLEIWISLCSQDYTQSIQSLKEIIHNEICQKLFYRLEVDKFSSQSCFTEEESQNIFNKLKENQIMYSDNTIRVSNQKYAYGDQIPLTKYLQLLSQSIYDSKCEYLINKSGDIITTIGIYLRRLDQVRDFIIPTALQTFVKENLMNWVESSIQAKFFLQENNHYEIKIDKSKDSKQGEADIIIIDKDTGVEQFNSQWGNGIHQFLQLKHGLQIKKQSLTAIFTSNFKYSELYSRILGLTGTLGYGIEKNMLQKIFQSTQIKIPLNTPSKLQIFEPIAYNTEIQVLAKVSQDTINKIKQKRPVLLICENISQANLIYNYITEEIKQLESDIDFPNCDIIKYTSSTDEFQSDIHNPTIIISTNLAGRGTDIKMTAQLNKNGGLHVIVASLPSNQRVQYQAYGRAARASHNGSCQMIFNVQDENFFDRDVYYYLMMRDQQESIRVRQIESDYYSKIQVLEKLFKDFQDSYNKLKSKNITTKDEVNEIIQLWCIDKWAIFLDSQTKVTNGFSRMIDLRQQQLLKIQIYRSMNDFIQKQILQIEKTNMYEELSGIRLMEIIHYMQHGESTQNIIENVQNLSYERLFEYVRNKNPSLAGLSYFYQGCYAYDQADCQNRRQRNDYVINNLRIAECYFEHQNREIEFKILRLKKSNKEQPITQYENQKRKEQNSIFQFKIAIESILGKNINLKPKKWEEETNFFDKNYGFSQDNLKQISFELRKSNIIYQQLRVNQDRMEQKVYQLLGWGDHQYDQPCLSPGLNDSTYFTLQGQFFKLKDLSDNSSIEEIYFDNFLPSKPKLWEIMKICNLISVVDKTVRECDKQSIKQKATNLAQTWVNSNWDIFRRGVRNINQTVKDSYTKLMVDFVVNELQKEFEQIVPEQQTVIEEKKTEIAIIDITQKISGLEIRTNTCKIAVNWDQISEQSFDWIERALIADNQIQILSRFNERKKQIIDALNQDRILKNGRIRVSNVRKLRTDNLKNLFGLDGHGSFIYSMVILTVQYHQVYRRAMYDIVENTYIKPYEILQTKSQNSTEQNLSYLNYNNSDVPEHAIKEYEQSQQQFKQNQLIQEFRGASNIAQEYIGDDNDGDVECKIDEVNMPSQNQVQQILQQDFDYIHSDDIQNLEEQKIQKLMQKYLGMGFDNEQAKLQAQIELGGEYITDIEVDLLIGQNIIKKDRYNQLKIMVKYENIFMDLAKALVLNASSIFGFVRIYKYLRAKLTITQDFEGMHEIPASGDLINSITNDINKTILDQVLSVNLVTLPKFKGSQAEIKQALKNIPIGILQIQNGIDQAQDIQQKFEKAKMQLKNSKNKKNKQKKQTKSKIVHSAISEQQVLDDLSKCINQYIGILEQQRQKDDYEIQDPQFIYKRLDEAMTEQIIASEKDKKMLTLIEQAQWIPIWRNIQDNQCFFIPQIQERANTSIGWIIIGIGLLQVAAGVAIGVFCGWTGVGLFIAEQLISEGVSDLVYAGTALITGEGLNWRDYKEHKIESIKLTALTAGVFGGLKALKYLKYAKYGSKAKVLGKLGFKKQSLKALKVVGEEVLQQTLITQAFDKGSELILSQLTNTINVYIDGIIGQTMRDFKDEKKVKKVIHCLIRASSHSIGIQQMQNKLSDIVYQVQKETNYNEWLGETITDSANSIVEGISSASKSNKLKYLNYANYGVQYGVQAVNLNKIIDKFGQVKSGIDEFMESFTEEYEKIEDLTEQQKQDMSSMEKQIQNLISQPMDYMRGKVEDELVNQVYKAYEQIYQFFERELTQTFKNQAHKIIHNIIKTGVQWAGQKFIDRSKDQLKAKLGAIYGKKNKNGINHLHNSETIENHKQQDLTTKNHQNIFDSNTQIQKGLSNCKDAKHYADLINKTNAEPLVPVTLKALSTIIGAPVMLIDKRDPQNQKYNDPNVIKLPIEKLNDNSIAIQINGQHIRINEQNALIQAVCLQKGYDLNEPKTIKLISELRNQISKQCLIDPYIKNHIEKGTNLTLGYTFQLKDLNIQYNPRKQAIVNNEGQGNIRKQHQDEFNTADINNKKQKYDEYDGIDRKKNDDGNNNMKKYQDQADGVEGKKQQGEIDANNTKKQQDQLDDHMDDKKKQQGDVDERIKQQDVLDDDIGKKKKYDENDGPDGKKHELELDEQQRKKQLDNIDQNDKKKHDFNRGISLNKNKHPLEKKKTLKETKKEKQKDQQNKDTIKQKKKKKRDESKQQNQGQEQQENSTIRGCFQKAQEKISGFIKWICEGSAHVIYWLIVKLCICCFFGLCPAVAVIETFIKKIFKYLEKAITYLCLGCCCCYCLLGDPKKKKDQKDPQQSRQYGHQALIETKQHELANRDIQIYAAMDKNKNQNICTICNQKQCICSVVSSENMSNIQVSDDINISQSINIEQNTDQIPNKGCFNKLQDIFTSCFSQTSKNNLQESEHLQSQDFEIQIPNGQLNIQQNNDYQQFNDEQ